MYENKIIGMKKGTIELLKHNEEWHDIANESIDDLKECLGTNVINIQHVGSTSIHNIYAKPIIDLAIGLTEKKDILKDDMLLKMNQLGYIHDEKHDNAGKIFFYKGEDIITHYVHVVNHKENAWNSYVGFRDYLNSDYEMACEYQNVKLEAQRICNNDLDKYYNAKAKLLKEINGKVKAWLKS